MPENCCGREACSCCGSDSWTEAHFRHGHVICLGCWREIERHKAKAPPSQESLALAQAAQQEGGFHE